MTAAEKVEEIAKDERHLTREESRFWCNRYLTLCRELAIELDAARMQLYRLQYKPAVPTFPANPPPAETMTKGQKISEHMKHYWAERKAKENR